MKNSLNIFLLLFALIPILGCKSSTSSEFQNESFQAEFKVEFGKEVIVSPEEILVRFTDVLSDSRCPEDLSCGWSGNAEIEIYVGENKINLNLFSNPTAVQLSNYSIKLNWLSPQRNTQKNITKEDYVATISITKVVN